MGSLVRGLEAVEQIPCLAHSRARSIELLGQRGFAWDELVTLVESDPGLTLAALRVANAGDGCVTGVPAAVGIAQPNALRAALEKLPAYDPLEHTDDESLAADRLRIHALTTQRMATVLHHELELGTRDELVSAALLHDIGKLVLAHAYPRYRELLARPASPSQRVALERRQLSIDHASAGGLAVRRLGLPVRLGRIIQRHHDADHDDEVAIVGLADMLAHYVAGKPVDRRALTQLAAARGLDIERLRALLYRLPDLTGRQVPRTASPLSTRQRELLTRLRNGKTLKQVAVELGLRATTLRTHLHLACKKLGVRDRAQAVLLAAERGWLDPLEH